MKNDYDISVIIPCYNVEKYIERCMNSLVNQTIGFENLEVIFINDASTDGTLPILLEYEKKYKNVNVISYETNLRQGGARNHGIRVATAKWISFIDSDDWVSEDMYEVLLGGARERECDMVHAVLRRMDSYDLPKEETKGMYYFESEKINGLCHLSAVPKEFQNSLGIIPMLVKKNIIIDNNLIFPEHMAYEDNYWVSLLKLYVGTVCFIDRVVYYYYNNPCSTVNTKNSMHQLDRLLIEEMLIEEYEKRGAFELFYNDYFEMLIQRYYLNTWFVFYRSFEDLPDVFLRMIKFIKEKFPDYKELVRDRYERDCANNKLLLLPILFPEINEDGEYFENVRALHNYLSQKIDVSELTVTIVNKLLADAQRTDLEVALTEYELLLYRARVNGYNKSVLLDALLNIIKNVGLSDEMLTIVTWLLVCVSKDRKYIDFFYSILQSFGDDIKKTFFLKIEKLIYLYRIG